MANTNIMGYSIDLDNMKSSTCGMIGIAQKSGKKYFCKKFNNPVEPGDNGALSPRAIEKNRIEFDRFRRRKTRINQTLRSISGPGGNIICPVEELIYEHHWTEFTEFIDGALPDNQYAEVIAGLNDNEKLLALKIAIGALQTIHGQRIIHGDLKLTNIMLVKNSSGHYVSKIIDFDGAFFEDDVPLDSITGTVDYYSPELAVYSSFDDPEIREKLSKMITTKSDIFTMGLILHEYLSGAKPEADHLTASLQKMKNAGKFIYPWQVLLAKDKDETKPQLVISSKITEPAYIALISDMLNLEPERRPSAAEVMTRLNYMQLPIELDTWPEDHIAIIEAEARKKLVGLRKFQIVRKDKSPVHCYEIIERDGRRYNQSAVDLLHAGYAKIEECWAPPRPEDNIEWNLDSLKRLFVSIYPGEGRGTYQLLDKHGTARVMTVAQLMHMEFAHGKSRSAPAPIPTPASPDPALWPEDAKRFKLDEKQLASFRIQFLGKAGMNEMKGYHFKMPNGDIQFWLPQKCKLMRIFTAK